MPAIRRTNLSRRTRNATSLRYTRACQTDDQHKTRNEIERNRWNRNQQQRNVAFNPYRASLLKQDNVCREMNQNGFSTGEEDSRGPLDKICCLQEDGFRCQRQAGNASYSKKIRNTVRQLKLHLDAVARHIYICDYHKNMIQSARSLKPSSQDEVPEVDFSQLQMNTLRRYKKHFKVVTKPSLNKAQMSEALFNHFKTIPVNEKEALTFFIYTIKTNGNKLDQKSANNNSDTM